MVEIKRLLAIFVMIIFSVNFISAFCFTQGYILDSNGASVDVSAVNIVCKSSFFEEKIIQDSGVGYGHPFGGLPEDCSYCDLGIYVNAIDKEGNIYGEVFNETCIVEGQDHCHSDIIVKAYSPGEPVESEAGSGGSSGGGGSAGTTEGTVDDLSLVPYYDYVPPVVEEDKNREIPEEFDPTDLKGVGNPQTRLLIRDILIVLFTIVIIVLFWRYKKSKRR